MTAFYDDRDSIQSYMADISFSKPLSREREVELSNRIQEGDTEARDELIEANLPFVISVARQYQNRGLPLSDLIGAGNLGLMTAAERFDGAKGFKFISYAVWWIRQSILVDLAEQPRTVHLPMNQIGLMQRISSARKQLESGQDRDAEEWAEELEVSVQRVKEALLSEERVRSMDSESGEEGNGHSLADCIPDPSQEPPDVAFERASEKAQLAHLLTLLDDRERYILRLYFGFDGGEPITLEEIGRTVGLTRERVRQLKERALKKLTYGARFRELRALVEE